MSDRAAEMGQGEGTLSRAAGLVAEAKLDFDGFSRALDGQVAGLRGQWAGAGAAAFFRLHTAWLEKQQVIIDALDGLAAALAATERDNLSTDESQSASYARTAGRLGG